MKRILAACVLLLMGSWASGQVNGQGGVYINGVLQAAMTWDYLHAGGISMTDPTTDVAPDPLLLKAANAWPGATANTTGANLILAGGIGRRIFTIIDYSHGSMAGSTATITTPLGSTNLEEGEDWTAGTSNNATATSLAAAINGVTGVSASASAAVVRIVPDAGTYSLTITKTAADAGMTATSGTDGTISAIAFGNGTTTLPGLSFQSSAGMGFYLASGFLTVTTNGTPTWQWDHTIGAKVHSAWQIGWTSGDATGSLDTGLARSAAGGSILQFFLESFY